MALSILTLEDQTQDMHNEESFLQFVISYNFTLHIVRRDSTLKSAKLQSITDLSLTTLHAANYIVYVEGLQFSRDQSSL